MNAPKRAILSPLTVFISALIAFEVFARLPYAIFIMNTPETGQLIHFHFFAARAPLNVIATGLTLAALAWLISCFAGLASGFHYDAPLDEGRAFPVVSSAIYPIALLFFIAAIAAVLSLGPEALIADISGKRAALSERGNTWILLRLAVFCHVILCLFYVRAHQTGQKRDWVGFAIALILVILPAIVFSARAILISVILEVIYLQVILGQFRLRRALRMLAIIAPVLVLISVLRPQAALLSPSETVVFGVEKILQSRYFFDFSKLGAVSLWAQENPWLGPVSFGFLLEPFLGPQVIYYKELGPMIAREVYFYRGIHGVTPGAFLEGYLSFGLFGGTLFFGLIVYGFLRLERSLIQKSKPTLAALFFPLLILSKFGLLLNSSLGAFAFQTATEAIILAIILIPLRGYSARD
ncbi:MAG: hypothetical protein ACJA06_000844 [Halocynthiibacter sp.]|jgi:hypothetical protein